MGRAHPLMVFRGLRFAGKRPRAAPSKKQEARTIGLLPAASKQNKNKHHAFLWQYHHLRSYPILRSLRASEGTTGASPVSARSRPPLLPVL